MHPPWPRGHGLRRSIPYRSPPPRRGEMRQRDDIVDTSRDATGAGRTWFAGEERAVGDFTGELAQQRKVSRADLHRRHGEVRVCAGVRLTLDANRDRARYRGAGAPSH